MKKKPLLFALLALAIVTSLTAGTLAVYTSTVDLGTATVQVKKYAFAGSGKIEGNEKAILLAPTEAMTYQFTITNEDKDIKSEVPLTYAIKANFVDAATKMPGLAAQLFIVNGNGQGNGNRKLLANSVNGMINYDSKQDNVKDVLKAEGKTEVRNFEVVLTWGVATDSAHTNAGETVTSTGGLSVDVIATQVT